jgi:hypothetical protein
MSPINLAASSVSFVSTDIKTVNTAKAAKIWVENKNLIVEGENITLVKLYSIVGQLIDTKSNMMHFTFALPYSGIYAVSIKYKNGQSETRKIVI